MIKVKLEELMLKKKIVTSGFIYKLENIGMSQIPFSFFFRKYRHLLYLVTSLRNDRLIKYKKLTE